MAENRKIQEYIFQSLSFDDKYSEALYYKENSEQIFFTIIFFGHNHFCSRDKNCSIVNIQYSAVFRKCMLV